eukprot:PITA_16382
MKSQIAELKKGKQVAKEEEEEDQPWNTAQYSSNQEVEVAEGIKDPNFGFREIRLLTISYQQHHVRVHICIRGEMFKMIALLDSGADINILNIKTIPTKYLVAAERKVVAVEPHGSIRLKGGKVGYFISVPTSKGTRKKIELPYISNPRISTMVQTVQNLDRVEARLLDLKDLKSTLRIEEQLKLPQMRSKIEELKKQIEDECCSEEPNAFWHRKQHTVELPYKEGYAGKLCKS